MKRAGRLLLGAAMFMACLGGTTAQAQTTHHVAWSKIQVGAWSLKPIYAETGNNAAEVVGFLALADLSGVTGDNIVAVWYQRTNGDWVSKSWETTDPWEAIKSVKDEMGISEDEDDRWEIDGSDDEITNAEEPKDFAQGVLSQDPMAEVVAAAPDSDELVEYLKSIGYKAADVPVEMDDTCKLYEKLDGLAANAVAMIASGDETILTVSAQISLCDIFASIPIGPRPTQPTQPATPPAWSPPGTVPTAPAWTPGGWPTTPAWRCRTVLIGGGGTNCICSRSQYWGRWETTTCGFWPFTYTCVRWHEIIETETCTDINTACPAGGPPSGQSNCVSGYQ